MLFILQVSILSEQLISSVMVSSPLLLTFGTLSLLLYFRLPSTFLPSKGRSITTLGTRWHDFFITLFRYFTIILFFTLHFFSFSQGMQTRERAHCVRSVFPFIKKKKKKTVPFHESRLCWIHDPTPSPPRCMEHTITEPPSDSSAPISSSSSVPIPSGTSIPIPSDSVRSPDKPVSVRNHHENQASAIATRGSPAAPLTPSLPKKCQRRRRRQAHRTANRKGAFDSATPVTPDER